MYVSEMRTTVEIDDTQRAELLRIAAERGEKGFSSLVREALDAYVQQHRAKKHLVESALCLEGVLGNGSEAEAFAASVQALRGRWR
jgi:metal-responsive CopG/Arc/MetJ family transcriptional regulator